jgi:hypothetical protein
LLRRLEAANQRDWHLAEENKRLRSERPERLSLTVLMALLDSLDCSMDDLIEPIATARSSRKKTTASREKRPGPETCDPINSSSCAAMPSGTCCGDSAAAPTAPTPPRPTGQRPPARQGGDRFPGLAHHHRDTLATCTQNDLDNLIARIAEGETEGWLGEGEGLQVRLAGTEERLRHLDRGHGQHVAVDPGIPTMRGDR